MEYAGEGRATGEDRSRVEAAERAEARAWADLVREGSGASGPFRMVERPTGLALVAPGVDVLAINRVHLGGMDRPLDGEGLRELRTLYLQAGVPRWFLPVSPLAPGLARLLAGAGHTPYNQWVRWTRDVSAPPWVLTDLRVRRVGPEHASDFAHILCRALEWPDACMRLVEASVGRPGWWHGMAFDGDRPVATGAFHLPRGASVAWLDMASTVPEHRGRGAQTALLAERILQARRAGATLLVMETADGEDGRDAPSGRNARRLGFRTAYRRPNYLFG